MNGKLTCDDSGLGSNLEPGSEKVVESMNLIDQNQKNQEDSTFSRNKRSSEASANENLVKRTKYCNTGYGVSSRGIQNYIIFWQKFDISKGNYGLLNIGVMGRC